MKQKFVMMVCWICMIVMVASCNDKQDKTNLLSNPDNPVVKMETSYGDIFIELFEDTAPVTVENFIEYVNADFYDGTIFHRVINEFMIQGEVILQVYNQKKSESLLRMKPIMA